MAAPLWMLNLFSLAGGVIAKIRNNGSAVAPDNTTAQVILNFTGAATTYTPPGVGETYGTLEVPIVSALATPSANGLQSALDKAKLDTLLAQNTIQRVLTQDNRNALTKHVGILVYTQTDKLYWRCIDTASTGTWELCNPTLTVDGIFTDSIDATLGNLVTYDGISPRTNGALYLLVNESNGNHGLYRWTSSTFTFDTILGTGSTAPEGYIVRAASGTYQGGKCWSKSSTLAWTPIDTVDQHTLSKRILVPEDTGKMRPFGGEWIDIFVGTYNVEHHTIITEAEWGGAGTNNTGMTYQIALVEVDAIWDETGAAMTRQVWRGLIYKLTTAWAINSSLTRIVAEQVGGDEVNSIVTMSLSGANNGDISINFTPETSGDPESPIVLKIRIFGGGKFAT